MPGPLGNVLETPRLLMRQFREPDWDACAEMSADAEVMRYIGTGVTLTRDESWRSIADFLGPWQLRGYASEAARAALAHAFNGLGRAKVISLIRHGNARSIRVAEAIGARLAGEAEMLGAKAPVYEIVRA